MDCPLKTEEEEKKRYNPTGIRKVEIIVALTLWYTTKIFNFKGYLLNRRYFKQNFI